MGTQIQDLRRATFGAARVEIYADKAAAGRAAALAAAQAIVDLARSQKDLGVIFATGASQLEMLRTLTAIPDLPWDKVHGFHLDEYVGLDESHPASFRRYLRENLTQRVRMKEFSEIDGSASDPDRVCTDYARKLRAANPQVCLLGIGENGHLAFNDPGVADFHDPVDVKIAHLDEVCRRQQAAEGWFQHLQDVPERAITLTVPAVFRVPKLIVSVPGKRKARIVRRTLEDPISTDCPATILRTHPDVTIYLDAESAIELVPGESQR